MDKSYATSDQFNQAAITRAQEILSLVERFIGDEFTVKRDPNDPTILHVSRGEVSAEIQHNLEYDFRSAIDFVVSHDRLIVRSGNTDIAEFEISIDADTPNKVAGICAQILSEHPFNAFRWVRDEHDKKKHRLFSGGKNMGATWQHWDGRRSWGCTAGFEFASLSGAKEAMERTASTSLRNFHMARISDLIYSAPAKSTLTPRT